VHSSGSNSNSSISNSSSWLCEVKDWALRRIIAKAETKYADKQNHGITYTELLGKLNCNAELVQQGIHGETNIKSHKIKQIAKLK